MPTLLPTTMPTRRQWLAQSASGIGGLALAWLLHTEQTSAAEQGPHFPAKAKRVIHIFSPGGVSHVDTFDYRPELERLDGKNLEGKGEIDTFFAVPGVLRKSFYPFSQRGESGAWVSDLFPHLAKCADDLTFLKAMVAKSPSHQPACFQMNTGFTLQGFPSLGAWLSYGLGRVSDNLPSFVVLPDPRGLVNGGTANWTNGFLPAEHQGSLFDMGKEDPVSHLHTPAAISAAQRERGLELVQQLNTDFANEDPHDSSLTARLRAYELAAKMQASIPEALQFQDETAETRKLYGVDDAVVGPTARNFLLGAAVSGAGGALVQIYNGGALGSPRINWDAHENVKDNHDRQAKLLDQPCAALLTDLKQRGMLNDTLVIWTTEFGRTPFTQGPSGLGRDHHQHVFTCWLAGAGLKPGFCWGASDEVGYKPAENTTSIYDLHATILHLLGLDHERLTYLHNGLQRRLTDVHGHVVKDILS